MKSLLLLLLSCLSVSAQSPLTTGSGIDWTKPSAGPLVTDWSTRVVANGGATPSQATITAEYNFLVGLTNDSLNNLIYTCNFFAPDSLIASLTPLLVGGGSDPWANNNFVVGDLTVNGLKGNGTTKYLGIGIAPATIFTSTDSGLVLYVYDNTSNTGVDIGSQQQSTTSVSLLANQSSSTTVESYNFTAGQGLLATGGALGNGYTAAFRTAANSLNIYFANSGSAHASAASSATTGGTIGGVTGGTYGFALDLVNPVPAPCCWSVSRLSFMAMTKGMSSAQSALLYARIQTLRTALGGGFR